MFFAFNLISGGQISEIQNEILNQISLNQKIIRKQFSFILNMNESAIQKHIDKLNNLKIISRKGSTRSYWIINLQKYVHR